MAEPVDAQHLKCCIRKDVWVRLPLEPHFLLDLAARLALQY